MHIKRCRRQRRAPGRVLFPVVWLTNRCNLRCVMCDQWKSPAGSFSSELSAGDWCRFVDEVAGMGASVMVITGGEALLRGDVFSVIERIRARSFSSHLCSNGTLLSRDVVAALRESGLNSISVSLDSDSAEVHNSLRGADCFDRVVEGIKILRAEAPGIKVGINCVISRRNLRGLRRLVRFAGRLGVSLVKFDPIHTNLMHRVKARESFGDLLLRPDDLPDLANEVREIRAEAAREGVTTNSARFFNGMAATVEGRVPRLPCYAGYISCAVDPFGRVSVCDDFDGAESIRDKSFRQIWEGPALALQREKVLACPGCWDTTHAELNLRCLHPWSLASLGQIGRDLRFYRA